MTLAEFVTLHTTGLINFDNQLHVLYNPINSTEGEIIALSITHNALTVNGSTALENTDIENILQQVEVIKLTYDSVDYNLTVVTGNNYSSAPTPFFIFQVTSPINVPDITGAPFQFNSNEGDGLTVNFEPTLLFGNFETSDYNALFSNAIVLRASKYILESDREIGSIAPSNFEAIRTLAASKAKVQDSFYTDTGLKNARYTGTLSTPDIYAGVTPSLSAREFIGEVNPADADLNLVCVYNRDKLLQPLLHTGPENLPRLQSSSLYIQTPGGNTIDQTEVVLEYNYTTGIPGGLRPTIDRGDVLKFENYDELIRVIEHNSFNKRIKVTRGVLGTNIETSINPATEILKIDRTDIYKIDDFVRNLSAISNKVVYVEANHTAVVTDEFGLVYQQITCPDPDEDFTFDDAAGSDRRLKYNIKLVGKSPSSINIYNFEYKDKAKFGYGIYQGVMSDEVSKEAVIVGADGYDRVNYSLLDVEFKKVND